MFSAIFDRKYLEEPCVWVESNTTKLSILSSHAEIALGFLLILSQFSSVIQLSSRSFPIIPNNFFYNIHLFVFLHAGGSAT